MSKLTAVAMLLLMVTGVNVMAAETTAVDKKPILAFRLGDLSYPNGITFDDSSLPNEHPFVFLLPLDNGPEQGTLHLLYRGTPSLSDSAALSVTINNMAEQTHALIADGDTHSWDIPLSKALLHTGQLKVILKGNVPVAFDHCVNNQPDSGKIHLSPASALIFTNSSLPQSIRDAWLLLPGQVTVSLPASPLDTHLMETALEWISLLKREHHSVVIKRLPVLGQLAIAPADEIAAALGKPADESLWNDQNTNIGVVFKEQMPTIAVSAPYANAQRFIDHWRELSGPAGVDSTTPQPREKTLELPLNKIGIPIGYAELDSKLQFNGTITPWNLPPGTRPRIANLQLQLPDLAAGDFLLLYAYINDHLVMTKRFAGVTNTASLAIPFDTPTIDNINQLRLVIRRGTSNGCIEPDSIVPVGITPDSNIEVENEDRLAQGFSSLPTALGHGFDLYLPRAALAAPDHYLSLLGGVLGGFSTIPDNYKLIFYDHAAEVNPQRIFIMIGESPPPSSTHPLHFDRGEMKLVANDDSLLLSDSQMRSMTAIQMVKKGDIAGLWIHPGNKDEFPQVDALQLGDNDLAFFDADHMVLTLDSRQEDIARISYKAIPRWFERMHKHRLIWLAIAWFLLTAGIIYLHVKSRQHRQH